VPLIPSVIGLTPEDRIVDVEIAVHAVGAALPIAAFDRQRVLAVSALRCLRVLDTTEGKTAESLKTEICAALDQVPAAAAWARRFFDRRWGRTQDFRKHTAPHIVHFSVQSIALACVDDVDDRLCGLLEGTIAALQERMASRSTQARPASGDTIHAR
jgi:hypothetical protein